ncbi:MAG: hypothetical protein VR73_02810 [Gammaproteobacteria bacterium BRH_c0]|nr:MAG: hypothetical protein VR73_02810 [Gammaproteobacteria bacterium BRH_c0]
MTDKPCNTTGIRTKLFLLSIIPVLIVTSIITWHTIETRSAEIEASLNKTTELTAGNLAAISDFALYSARADLLKPLTMAAEQIPSILSVVFLDHNRDILFASGSTTAPSPREYKNGEYTALNDTRLVIEKPVYLTNLDVSDYEYEEAESDGEKNLLGWVVVSADKSAMEQQTRAILLTHVLISLVILTGAAILTYFLSNKVVQPIIAMTRMVRELEQGNLYTQLNPTSNDELAILAQGINHLAQTVAESRHNLQKKVSDATIQLQKTLDDLKKNNLALDHARQDAEAANQAKSDFLAQMSHELRTPITAIQGFVRLLGDSKLDSAEKRYCEIIQQASLQLLQLIDDILDITRLQSNGIVLETSVFNLTDCIETPISLMAPTAHQKGLELILDIAPDVPQALIGDTLRVRQIVYNLVSNAIKFTTSGEVVVQVQTRGSDHNTARLAISVIDTGIGIPEKQRALIFEPFSQADNSISRRFGGSGLGLTIVRNLVMQMGGNINIESMAGKGTTFRVELPLPLAPFQPSTATARYQCALLFDPHPHSRQAMEHMLGNFVVNIESCETTADLEIGGKFQAPDIIVYSVPVGQAAGMFDQHAAYLKERFSCPILIISPLNTLTAALHQDQMPYQQPVLFMDKPPVIAEIIEIFTEQSREKNGNHFAGGASLQANILIAEDNEFNRLLLSTFMQKLGSHYTTVTNGLEAIIICDQQPFDLILMDVHMPEVNGINAVKNIRSGHGPNRDTPIVMLTADILQQEENALFDAGANDLLFKPFDEARLFTTLRQHLQIPALPAADSDHPAQTPSHVDLELFIHEVAKLTHSAQTAIDSRNDDSLRESIHQLLGIAGVFKMTYLERAVRALHLAVKNQDEEKTYAAMDTLGMEVEQLRKSIAG